VGGGGPFIGRQRAAAASVGPAGAGSASASAASATVKATSNRRFSAPGAAHELWSADIGALEEDAAALLAGSPAAATSPGSTLATGPAITGAGLHSPSAAAIPTCSMDPLGGASRRSTVSGLRALLAGRGSTGGGTRWRHGARAHSGDEPEQLPSAASQLQEEGSGATDAGSTSNRHSRRLRPPAWLALSLAVASRGGGRGRANRASEPAYMSLPRPCERAGAGGGWRAWALVSADATEPACSSSSTASRRPPRPPPPPRLHPGPDDLCASRTTFAKSGRHGRSASLTHLLRPLRLLSRGSRAPPAMSPTHLPQSLAPPLPSTPSHHAVASPPAGLDKEMRTAIAIRGRAASVTGIWLPDALGVDLGVGAGADSGFTGSASVAPSHSARLATSTPEWDRPRLLSSRGLLQMAIEQQQQQQQLHLQQQQKAAAVATAAAATAERGAGCGSGGTTVAAAASGGLWEARLDALMRQQLTGSRSVAASWNGGWGPTMSRSSSSSSRVSRNGRALAASLRRLMGGLTAVSGSAGEGRLEQLGGPLLCTEVWVAAAHEGLRACGIGGAEIPYPEQRTSRGPIVRGRE
jgi:hypothetical protein